MGDRVSTSPSPWETVFQVVVSCSVSPVVEVMTLLLRVCRPSQSVRLVVCQSLWTVSQTAIVSQHQVSPNRTVKMSDFLDRFAPSKVVKTSVALSPLALRV